MEIGAVNNAKMNFVSIAKVASINNLHASLYINYTKNNNGEFFYIAYYYLYCVQI